MSVPLDLVTKGSSRTSYSTEKEYSNGKIVGLTRGDGRTEKCMASVYFRGPTGTDTRGSTTIVRSRAKEPSIGIMEKCSWENG